MNPLGSLPASNSPSWGLNSMDWLKIARALLVALFSLALTQGVPMLMHFSYVFHGVDLTIYVFGAINVAAEAMRRFVAGNS